MTNSNPPRKKSPGKKKEGTPKKTPEKPGHETQQPVRIPALEQSVRDDELRKLKELARRGLRVGTVVSINNGDGTTSEGQITSADNTPVESVLVTKPVKNAKGEIIRVDKQFVKIDDLSQVQDLEDTTQANGPVLESVVQANHEDQGDDRSIAEKPLRKIPEEDTEIFGNLKGGDEIGEQELSEFIQSLPLKWRDKFDDTDKEMLKIIRANINKPTIVEKTSEEMQGNPAYFDVKDETIYLNADLDKQNFIESLLFEGLNFRNTNALKEAQDGKKKTEIKSPREISKLTTAAEFNTTRRNARVLELINRDAEMSEKLTLSAKRAIEAFEDDNVSEKSIMELPHNSEAKDGTGQLSSYDRYEYETIAAIQDDQALRSKLLGVVGESAREDNGALRQHINKNKETIQVKEVARVNVLGKDASEELKAFNFWPTATSKSTKSDATRVIHWDEKLTILNEYLIRQQERSSDKARKQELSAMLKEVQRNKPSPGIIALASKELKDSGLDVSKVREQAR